MPRRNYSRDTRRRPVPPSDAALQYLRTTWTPAPPQTDPCVVCGELLPFGWRYPEHARCRDGAA